MSIEKLPLIAVVTGASHGLGKAIAFLLAQNGYHVMRAQRTVRDQFGIGLDEVRNPNTRDIFLDLSQPDSVEAFVQRIRDEVPYINLLVNNAAICPKYPESLDLRRKHWHAVFETNFVGTAVLTEGLLPCMEGAEPQGRVINVSSGDGELLFFREHIQQKFVDISNGDSLVKARQQLQRLAEVLLEEHQDMQFDNSIFNGQPAYKISKAALNTYTRVAGRRRTIGSSLVSFIAVCPGDVETGMADHDAETISPARAAKLMWAELDLSLICKNGCFLRHGEEIKW